MFSDKPRNYITIRDLIEQYSERDDNVSKQICQLLECTQTFLSKTTPDFQVNRSKWINDQTSLLYFNTLADGLAKYSKNPRKDPEITKNYDYCLLAIKERLGVLKENKDKIYIHYSSYKNNLKDLIGEVASPALTKK